MEGTPHSPFRRSRHIPNAGQPSFRRANCIFDSASSVKIRRMFNISTYVADICDILVPRVECSWTLAMNVLAQGGQDQRHGGQGLRLCTIGKGAKCREQNSRTTLSHFRSGLPTQRYGANALNASSISFDAHVDDSFIHDSLGDVFTRSISFPK